MIHSRYLYKFQEFYYFLQHFDYFPNFKAKDKYFNYFSFHQSSYLLPIDRLDYCHLLGGYFSVFESALTPHMNVFYCISKLQFSKLPTNCHIIFLGLLRFYHNSELFVQIQLFSIYYIFHKTSKLVFFQVLGLTLFKGISSVVLQNADILLFADLSKFKFYFFH